MGIAFWNPACEFNYRIQYLIGSEMLDLSPTSIQRGGRLVDSTESIEYRKFILVEKSIVSGRINIFFRLPHKGIYYFTLFSCVPNIRTFEESQKDPTKWSHKLR